MSHPGKRCENISFSTGRETESWLGSVVSLGPHSFHNAQTCSLFGCQARVPRHKFYAQGKHGELWNAPHPGDIQVLPALLGHLGSTFIPGLLDSWESPSNMHREAEHKTRYMAALPASRSHSSSWASQQYLLVFFSSRLWLLPDGVLGKNTLPYLSCFPT